MPPRRFTDQQEEVIADRYQNGETADVLADHHGVSRGTITAAIRRRGAVPRQGVDAHPRSLTPTQEASLLRDYETGLPVDAIKDKYGCSHSTLQRTIGRSGGRSRIRGPQFTLPQEQTGELSRRHDSGVSANELARLRGVAGSTVRRALKRNGYGARDHFASCQVRDNRTYMVNESYFQHLDTPEVCRIAGFIAADGCVTQNASTGGWTMKVSLMASDVGHLEYIASRLGFTGGLKHIMSRGFRNNKPSPQVVLAIHSKRLCSDLIKHGITQRKTFTLVPPDLPDDLLRHFFAGMIDGDGWFTVGTTCRNAFQLGLCGASEVCINAYREFVFRRTGFSPCHQLRGTVHRATNGGRRRVQTLARLFYSDLGGAVPLQRKVAVATHILSATGIEPIPYDSFTASEIETLYHEHGSWTTVASLLGLPLSSLYCLRDYLYSRLSDATSIFDHNE